MMDGTSAAVRLSCGMSSDLRTCQDMGQGFVNLPVLRATKMLWILSAGHVSLEHWGFCRNNAVFTVFSEGTSKISVLVIRHGA